MKTRITLFFLAALLLASCCKDEPGGDTDVFRRVFLVYSAGFNNLSTNLISNIDEMCSGSGVPGQHSRDVLLVVNHRTLRFKDYADKMSPCLYRVYKDGAGKVVRDTLEVYPSGSGLVDPVSVSSILDYVRNNFKAKEYGMMLSSHATGYLPVNYKSENEWVYFSVFSMDGCEYPPTKSVGVENTDATHTIEMELEAFARAIPFKLDFIIMDACLMGGVEDLYALKDKCSYYVASPTEVLTSGFDYSGILDNVFCSGSADLKAVCDDFYEKYNKKTGLNKSATIALCDCSKVDELTEVFKSVIDNNREGFDNINPGSVQPYFYKTSSRYFYDFRDIVKVAGAGAMELNRLDRALESCVIYKLATEKFFDVPMDNFSGLSMYIPLSDSPELNEYYRFLSWNKAVSLIK